MAAAAAAAARATARAMAHTTATCRSTAHDDDDSESDGGGDGGEGLHRPAGGGGGCGGRRWRLCDAAAASARGLLQRLELTSSAATGAAAIGAAAGAPAVAAVADAEAADAIGRGGGGASGGGTASVGVADRRGTGGADAAREATEATKTTTAVAPTTSVMVARCDATGAEEGEAAAPPPRLSAADEPVTDAIKGEWLEATLLFGSSGAGRGVPRGRASSRSSLPPSSSRYLSRPVPIKF